jgi:outer membrane lipoprotein-sorting protein
MCRNGRIILAVVATLALVLTGVAGLRAETVLPDSPEGLLRLAEASGAKCCYTAVGTTHVRENGKRIALEFRKYHARAHRLRIEYLSNPLKGVVVVHSDRMTWRMDPKMGKLERVDHVYPPGRFRSLKLLLKNHAVETGDGGQVAGRPTILLIVKSKTGVVRNRTWFDASTYVTLRTENYDAEGEQVSSTEYRSITYADSLPSSLFDLPEGKFRTRSHEKATESMSLDRLSSEVGFQVVLPAFMPAGYKRTGSRLLTIPKSDRKAAFLSYSNGLDSISIFEARRSSADPRKDALRSAGRLVGHNGQVRISVADTPVMSYVVIGELSRLQLDRIADSLR